MINLFEYQNKIGIEDSMSGLEGFLDEIWNTRELRSLHTENGETLSDTQRFLQFLHKSNEVKSNKYVGVIHYQGSKINLLPKIFFESGKEYSALDINHIHHHILWWLSYCRKIKFPNYHTSLGSKKSDFFEILIYLFSKYTRALLNSIIYQQYQEISREQAFLKGRLNSTEYINENISKGNWHKISCTYDAFVFDNEFNRIIKYVARLLYNATLNQDNKKYLREILFILDEVSDEKKTAEQCSRISFNPMFGDFETVRDYCHLFLSNCVSFDFKNELKLFAFLLPTEYVFEDFVFGFIDKEISEISAKSQRSDTYLDESQIFQLKPDLWLKTPQKSLIADTKYKIVYSDEKDPKKGVSQTDLYQMLAYSVRFNADEIILFYPDTIKEYQASQTELMIKDTHANNKEIKVKVCQLPIINRELFLKKEGDGQDLQELFSPTKLELKKRLASILMDNVVLNSYRCD